MTDERYNGWRNYETWAVALWIGNEEGSYTYWCKEQAEECYTAAVQATEGDRDEWTSDAAGELARRLKDELDDQAELPKALDGTMYADLLDAALSEVDWREIAEGFIEDLDREEIERSCGAIE